MRVDGYLSDSTNDFRTLMRTKTHLSQRNAITINTAPTIATASSINAVGKSRPNARANAPLALAPPKVPITAPTTPAIRPPGKPPCAAPIAAATQPTQDDTRAELHRHGTARCLN